MRIANRIIIALAAAAGAFAAASGGCYKPDYASNPDAKMGFRCHKSDNPACPVGFVCCLDGLCGDDLKDTDEGWCIPPPPPVDMTVTGVKFWPFPSKGMFFSGVYTPAQLTGYDDQMTWRCTRDDTNPNPPDAIARQHEPNDLPDSAVVLSNPLPDETANLMGTALQICPDKTAPDLPDVDVYKFKLSSPARVIIELKYTAALGDIDVGLFRMDLDDETQQMKPTLIASDLTGVDNACLEVPNLSPPPNGTYYYIVVRGAIIPDMPGKYTMNDYRLRAFIPMSTTYSCNKKPDMGP